MLANKPFHGSRRSTFSPNTENPFRESGRAEEDPPTKFRPRDRKEEEREHGKKKKKSGKNVAKSGDLEGDKRGGGGAQAKLERIQLDLVASCILPFQCLSARYRRRRFAAGTRTRYTRVPTRSRIAYLAFYDPRAGPKSPFQRNWNREPTRPILEPIDKRSGTGVARAFLFPTIAVSPSLFPCSTLLSCIFSRLSLVTRFKRIEIESSSNPPKFSINNS